MKYSKRILILLIFMLGVWAPISSAKDISITISRVTKHGDFTYNPKEMEVDGVKKTFYVFNEPYVDISEVVSVAVFAVPYTDRFGIFVILTNAGSNRIKKVVSENPDEIIGVVIQDKLCFVGPAQGAIRRDRIKTEPIFSKNEAQNIIKAFLALSQGGLEIRGATLILFGVGFFIISSGVVMMAVAVHRGRITRRRQKHLADLNQIRHDDMNKEL